MTSHRGTTTLEVVVAMSLLVAALWSTHAFYNRIVDGRKLLMQTNQVQRYLNNARAEIATWPADTIGDQRIRQLPLDDASDSLTQAKWIVNVEQITNPLPSKQISLAIQWQSSQQTYTSPSLTFWVSSQVQPDTPDVK